jgi:hypothetical protein
MKKMSDFRSNAAASVADFAFNEKRVRSMSACEAPQKQGGRGVVYWMSRDQRVQDNWALLYSQKLALEMKVPLHVYFALVPRFLDATLRQFAFLLKGLREVEQVSFALLSIERMVNDALMTGMPAPAHRLSSAFRPRGRSSAVVRQGAQDGRCGG